MANYSWASDSSPERVLQEFNALRDDATSDPAAPAWWAAGRALHELGRPQEAVDCFTEALNRATDDDRVRIVISLAAALHSAGRTAEATVVLHDLTGSTSGVTQAVAQSQLAWVVMHSGEYERALVLLDQALPVIEASPDHVDVAARGYVNALHCELHLGRLSAAVDRGHHTISVAERSGHAEIVAGTLQNIGYAYMKQGRFPEALRELEAAAERFRALGSPARTMAVLYDDFAETYRAAGLSTEAIGSARRSLDLAVQTGQAAQSAEALLQLARCLLDAGRNSEASGYARTAHRAFEEAGRPLFAVRAALLELEAVHPEERASDEVKNRAFVSLDQLVSAGWHSEVPALRNRLAHSLLQAGDRAGVIALIDRPTPVDESVLGQVESLYGEALRAAARGQSVGPAAGEAHDLLIEHQLRLADAELRAGVARTRDRFRHLVVGEALDLDDAAKVLIEEERWRARSFDLPVHAVSRHSGVADLLEQLRLAGDEADSVVELEERLRLVSRQSRPGPQQNDDAVQVVDRRVRDLDLTALQTSIADGAFVEWIEVVGQLWAVEVSAGAVHSWHCGELTALEAETTTVSRTMARLMRPGLSASMQTVLWDAVRADCEQIRARLFAGSAAGAQRMVISPPAEVVGLPWPLIVPERGVRLTITPSATLWLRARTHPALVRAGALVGPDLPFSRGDVGALQASIPNVKVVEGAAATAKGARELIGEVDLLHIAAHGVFRSDSPRFSSLRLSDGAFTLYELDEVARVPRTVVMASCSAAASRNMGGGELLGAVPAWLDAGSTTVIAASAPIPDRETGRVMAEFYRHLPGRSPSEALARTQQVTAVGGSIAESATAALLVAFGGNDASNPPA